MAKGKPAGPNRIVVDMLEVLEAFVVEWITALAEGHFSAKMRRSTFITLTRNQVVGTTVN